MNRRKFLAALGSASAVGIAGCNTLPGNNTETPTDEPTDTPTDTPTTEEPKDLRGAYIQSHRDEMEMLGMKSDGRTKVALMYAKPHAFTLVTGTRTETVEVKPGDTMHLMAVVWDSETQTLSPQAEPSITIYRDDEEITSVNPWPMLSQPMGYHFGDNLQLRNEGTYRFEININADSAATDAALDDAFTGGSVTIEKSFNPFNGQSLGEKEVENPGKAGAVPPMDMDMVPVPQQPTYDEYPVEMTDVQYTNDMGVAVGAFDDASKFGAEGDHYLTVAPQTRYNRYLLPLMSVEATVTRDGETIYDGGLSSTLDVEAGHFYGAGTPALESGDTVTVEFLAPSQASRHEGYEEAFLQLDTLEFTLP